MANPCEFTIKYDLIKIDIQPKFNQEYLYSNFEDYVKFKNPELQKLWKLIFKAKPFSLRGVDGIFAIYVRDNFTCQYCGGTVEDGAKLTIDHIYPVNAGGGNDTYNLITSCQKCNMSKSKTLMPNSLIMKYWIDNETKKYNSILCENYKSLSAELDAYFSHRQIA